MNEPCAKITLDVQQASTATFVAVKRGDIGRKIVISLSDGGFPYEIAEDCYAVLTGTKPDGSILYNHCDIDGNTIVYEITEQTTAAAGRMKAEVKLYGADDSLVTSATFRIIIDGTVYTDSQVESSSEFSALTQLMGQVLEVIRNNSGNSGGGISITIVKELPTDDISTSTLYLVKDTDIQSNVYTEYLYVNGSWEIIGSQRLDLTGYIKTINGKGPDENGDFKIVSPDPGGKSAYEYAQDAGYTGTEEEFAQKLAEEPLVGPTSNITPLDVIIAVLSGREIIINYAHESLGMLYFASFSANTDIRIVYSSPILVNNNDDTYSVVTLHGNYVSNTWECVVKNNSSGGNAGFVIQDTEPEDTSMLWVDTDDDSEDGSQGSNTEIRITDAFQSSTTGETRHGVLIEGPKIVDEDGRVTINYATVWDGTTPHIGENGNWFIGETDTGVAAGGNADYVLDLEKYSISADGTNAEATTNGINQAIADAVTAGYGTIVFPKGEYLIAGSDQINITGRLTVDFNHSVLRKEANSNERYVIVEISGDHNVVKNATLYGDRETHDYSSGGTHEWSIGIYISPDSRFTIIENVDVFDTTGYGMNTGTAYNQIKPIHNRPLEAGCYDKGTGEFVTSTTHTILGYTLDITNIGIKNNMFILGGNGYCAHGITEPMSFYMTYYDENEVYLGFSLVHRLYDNIDLESLLHWYPTLRYIKFSIENADTETNVTLELRSSYTSDDITIKNCEIARCRTLGIAITGGKRILVENVSIHDIGGAAPGYGVDIEDGYQLNQYIVFRSCEFYNNKFGDIIAVKARDVLVENCRFQGFQRPEGGTAQPQGISAYGSITSKFVVRNSVFNGSSAGGEKFYLHNCIFIDCPGMEGDFTECRFHGCSIFNTSGTTLNRCYLNGTHLRYRNGNFGCYDSVLEKVSQIDESWSTGNPAEYWVMEGCLLKNCGLAPKTGVPYIRIANNTVYVKTNEGGCLNINTKQKTHCQIVGNTFEQGGRSNVVVLADTYGSDIYLEGNVFKSSLTSAEGIVNLRRVSCRSSGLVSLNANTFDIAYMVASIPVLELENCAKATLTNNKFFGNYGVPIKMTSVTEALCDGNEYTGTPALAENCKGVDIPNSCSKSYVDGLIGDVNSVIASINGIVGGA